MTKLEESKKPVLKCSACQEITKALQLAYHKTDFPRYFKCSLCKSLYLHPQPSDSELKVYYESQVINGAYNSAHSEQRIRSIEVFLKRTFKTTDIKSKLILDLGCFDGFLLKQLQSEGAEVFGIELQEEARNKANQILGENRVFPQLKSDFPKFDFICGKDFIEHLSNPNDLFQNLSNLVHAKSILFLQTPITTSLSSRLQRSRWVCLNSPEHTILFSEKGIRDFLLLHGWNITGVHRIGKTLQVEYVLSQLKNFGGYAKLASLFLKKLPHWILKIRFTFFGGERILIAERVL